jgi:hypothetical protein
MKKRLSTLGLCAGLLFGQTLAFAAGPCSPYNITVNCGTCAQPNTYLTCPLDQGDHSSRDVNAYSIELYQCRAVGGLGTCLKPDGSQSTCDNTQVIVYVCCQDGSNYPVFNLYVCCTVED